MKRIILVSILALAVLVIFVPLLGAEMAKEGSATATTYYVSTYPKALQQEKGRGQVIYQAIGIHVADNESSPFNYSTSNCVGAAKEEQGVYKEMGLCTSITPNGDKIYISYEATGKRDIGAKGTYKIVGGTGRFASITGSGEFERKSLRPPTAEHGASVSRHKYNWKIP